MNEKKTPSTIVQFVKWFFTEPEWSFRDYAQSSPRASTNPHVITSPRRSESVTGGILASAKRLTSDDTKEKGGRNAKTASAGKTAAWQDEAWELRDLIGEQRFLGDTLAGRMSQAALYVGKTSNLDAPGAQPINVEDERLQEIVNSIGGGESGRAQLLYRAGVNLFIAGEFWLVGIPPRYLPGTPEYDASTSREHLEDRIVDRTAPIQEDDVLDLRWKLLSVSEVSLETGGEAVTIQIEDGDALTLPIKPLYLIRIWRPHPRRAWEADSPTRASLPVLRELLGLTQHISAQVDSRLAGAGLLAISTQADAEIKRQSGIPENDPRSPFMEALTIAMQTPIRDRSSASALVPLAVTVPGKPSEHFHYMNFSTPLDAEARQLRDEAIRRLALGQDAPPELLLGTGGMNHWGAWLVREDVVTTHLEPPLALICDALTKEFLHPVMRSLGYEEEDLRDYVIWYDVDNLIARPNRTEDAKDLYNAGAITRSALREALGFSSSEAIEESENYDEAKQIVLDIILRKPELIESQGVDNLLGIVRGLLEGAEPRGRIDTRSSGSNSIPDTLGLDLSEIVK